MVTIGRYAVLNILMPFIVYRISNRLRPLKKLVLIWVASWSHDFVVSPICTRCMGRKWNQKPIAILRSLRHRIYNTPIHCNCWCVWYSNCCLEAIVECWGVGCIALPDTHGFGQMGIYVHFSSWGTSEIDIPCELELIDHTWRWLHASGITFGSIWRVFQPFSHSVPKV